MWPIHFHLNLAHIIWTLNRSSLYRVVPHLTLAIADKCVDVTLVLEVKVYTGGKVVVGKTKMS